MITAGKLDRRVTFQKTENGSEWEEYYTCYAYINGLSGTEFFIANAGFDAELTVNITCRYSPALMKVNPNTFRVVDSTGEIYNLISPADDIKLRHKEIKFRAKRGNENDNYR